MEFVEARCFEKKIEPITKYLQSINSNIRLINQKIPILTYEIENDIKLGLLFRKLEKKREELKISDYSIYQSSLEQIFNYFANEDFDTNLI